MALYIPDGGYSFDTKIGASAAELHQSAHYLEDQIAGQCVKWAKSVCQRASYSETIWKGESGEVFRSWMPQMLIWAEELRQCATDLAREIRKYAAAVADGEACAESIREECRQAGMTVSGTVVFSPDKEVSAPASTRADYDNAYRDYQINNRQWLQYRAAKEAWAICVEGMNGAAAVLRAFQESATSLVIPWCSDLLDATSEVYELYAKQGYGAKSLDKKARRAKSPRNRMALQEQAAAKRRKVKLSKGVKAGSTLAGIVFLGADVYNDIKAGESVTQAWVSNLSALAAGAATGAAYGAMWGSVVPGAGTLVGAAIGVVTGTILSFFTGQAVGNWVDSFWAEEPYYKAADPILAYTSTNPRAKPHPETVPSYNPRDPRGRA
ncbi:MAG: hypothetical protein LBR58_11110 [Propionibacteriaceae bacterium]|jgi:uncharacterized protein YukE|nr:hypothetical protein [Propionibacteriaceae bacterium]